MTRRHRALAKLTSRLQQIRQANGYATDAGLHVHYGAVEVTVDDDFPLITLVPGDLVRLEEGARAMVRLPVGIRALAVVDPDDELGSLEPLLGDLDKAVFGVDDKLEGEVSDVEYVTERVLDRVEGGKVGGVALAINLVWFKRLGDPDA